MGLFFGNKNEAASKDFTEANLPHNRKEQFFDICKIYYTKLFILGAILCLFFLPTIVVIIVRDIALINAVNAYGDNIEKLETIYGSIKLIGAGALIFSLMIFSIALAGSLKVVRRMIWGEPIFFKEDFKTGIKENVFMFLINTFVLGLFNVLRVYLELLIRKSNGSGFLSTVPLGILFAIIIPVCFTFYFASALYKNKYLSILNLSFNVYIRGFLSTIICCATIYVLFLLNLITGSGMIAKYLTLFVLSFLGFPFMILAYWENEIRLFDKHVNKNNFTKFYNRGIYSLEKENKKKRG